MIGRPVSGRRPGEDLRVLLVDSPELLDAAWSVRFEVFVDEQKVPHEEEVDAADTATTTTHVLVVAVLDGAWSPVGTGRLLSDPDHPRTLHVGRLAVRAPWRSSGVGSILMAELESLASAHAATGTDVRVELSAQEQAIGFYERLGYTIVGERYLDAGIWHRDAWKSLPGTGLA